MAGASGNDGKSMVIAGVVGEDVLSVADAAIQAAVAADSAPVAAMLAELRQVAAQRWPDEAQRRARPHDVVLMMADRRVWARFRESEGGHLEVELRPVDVEDLPAVGRVTDDRVAMALGYLADHYAQSPSLADVAGHVRTSTFHFHRLFSQAIGLTPKQYLMRTQLQAARWLLIATREPVGEIAARTGFASHGHFTATFHRLVGVSPSAYRQQAGD